MRNFVADEHPRKPRLRHRQLPAGIRVVVVRGDDGSSVTDRLEPSDVEPEETADLRAIARVMSDLAGAEKELVEAVTAARERGRSWARIGMFLGVSKEAVRLRWGPNVASR